MGEDISISLHDLLAREGPMALLRAGIMVVQKGDGAVGPPPDQAGGFPCPVAKAAVLTVHRHLKYSLGCEIEGGGFLAGFVEPVAKFLPVRILVEVQV